MVHHGVVVLHVQRLQNDIQMMVQLLALACFQYQLEDDINPNILFGFLPRLAPVLHSLQ